MCPKKFEVLTSDSYAGPGDAGRTGSWRVLRPVIDYAKCTPARKGKPACYLCWLYCPESVVSKTIRPEVDLEYCKGCGICAQECPTQAISMLAEDGFADQDGG
jgi:pyruvate ferredoxin oxidoreductase delta subunit